jgi:hypothetical protein
MAGREFRTPGRSGRWRQRTKDERQAASREQKKNTWDQRIANTGSVIETLRVLADQAYTVALQKERLAGTELKRARASGNPAAVTAAEARLEAARDAIKDDLNPILDQLTAFAARHETTRS